MALDALIAPDQLATLIRRALRSDDEDTAARLLPDAISRILHSAAPIAAELSAPPPSTGDARYDTLLATAYAWALDRRGATPADWMTAPPALAKEWLWDGDAEATPRFRDFIRSQTPEPFLAKRILLRARDLETA
jgi:hypothetical protein